MALFDMAIAPVIISVGYLFIRDKYEKEPYGMLLLGLFYGVYATFVILCVGSFLDRFLVVRDTPFFSAFIGSAGVEESIKFLFLYFLVWRNKNFNEPFDGIVYAAFLSLGFALLENIIYVYHEVLGGYLTAVSRALFSVPGHGLFGVQMGYYFAIAKFENKKKYLWLAFLIPYLFHGAYNYILFQKRYFGFIPFLILLFWLWRLSLKRMALLLARYPFKR